MKKILSVGKLKLTLESTSKLSEQEKFQINKEIYYLGLKQKSEITSKILVIMALATFLFTMTIALLNSDFFKNVENSNKYIFLLLPVIYGTLGIPYITKKIVHLSVSKIEEPMLDIDKVHSYKDLNHQLNVINKEISKINNKINEYYDISINLHLASIALYLVIGTIILIRFSYS